MSGPLHTDAAGCDCMECLTVTAPVTEWDGQRPRGARQRWEFSMMVTVLYYAGNQSVSILGAFSDDNPGSGKLNRAIDTHMEFLRTMGVPEVSRKNYFIREGLLDKPETWLA